MRTRLVLCFCVLGVVSAVDEQTQGHFPDVITPQNGSTSDSVFEASVATNSVQVLPNGSERTQDSEISGSSENLISIPAVKNENISFQENVDQPIPVPVYSSNETDPTKDYSNPKTSKIPPVPDLFKAPNEYYPSPLTNPSPLDLQSNNNLDNPFEEVSPSFRLWPKLPEPIPVPVLKNSYKKFNANLFPQYQQKVQVPVKVYSSIIKQYQQELAPARYPSNLPVQPQSNQPQQSNQGLIYYLVPTANNGQPNAYQPSSQNQGSYPQALPGNQGLIILAPPNYQQSAPSQSYQMNGFSSNSAYYGNQFQGQNNGFSNYTPIAQPYTQSGQSTYSGGQVPFTFPFAPYNAPVSQAGNSGSQPPLNIILLAPVNNQGNQASNNAYGQSPIIHTAFSSSNSQSASSANQPAFSSNIPSSPLQVSISGQNSLKHALFGPDYGQQNASAHKNVNVVIIPPTNAGQPIGTPNAPGQLPYIFYHSNINGELNNPSQTPSPQQPVSFPSTPSPFQGSFSPQSTPQTGNSVTPTPQGFGYSSTPTPPPYVGYSNAGFSASQAPPQFAVFSPTPFPPQYATQSSTQAAPQFPYYSPTQGPPQFYSPTQASPQFAGYSSTQSPPQYSNISPTQSPPQYVGYSSTQAPPQFASYSPNQAPPQYPNYSPTQGPPQFYSPTQSPPQYPNYSPTQGPPQFIVYSSTQAPQQIASFPPFQGPPQYAGYSSTPSPPQFGYSSTPAPPQFGYSSTPAPQYAGYSSTPAPQYAGYSPTQTPQIFGFTPAPTTQPGYSQPPVSSVSFAAPGSSYSYSIKKS